MLSSIALSIDVINVYHLNKVFETFHRSIAVLIYTHILLTNVAFFHDGLVEVKIDESVKLRHLYEGGCRIVFPVSHAIPNYEAFQIWNVRGLILGPVLLLLEIINPQSEIRNIDSSVGLPRKVELIILQLWELHRHDVKQGYQVVISGFGVTEAAFSLVRAHREADAGWTLDIDYGGFQIPRIRVLHKIRCAIFHHVGAVLLRPPEHGGAAGAAIKPENDWVILWISLTQSSDIVQLLRGTVDGNVPREEAELQVWHLIQLKHLIVRWSCGDKTQQGENS